MVRKGRETKTERKQIGVKLNSALWTQMKILALKKDTTGGELLEKAIKEYLEKYDRGGGI